MYDDLSEWLPQELFSYGERNRVVGSITITTLDWNKESQKKRGKAEKRSKVV